jgi:4-hydroxybenzoate polyprenyltransferase
MEKLRHIFWLIRPVNLFFIALTSYAIRFWLLQPFFNRFELDFFTSNAEFAMLVLSFVCIAGGGNAINDYFDTKADLVNKPKSAIVNVHLDRRYAMWAHQALSILGFFLAAYYAFINDTLLLLSFHGFAIVSLWYYSFEFKKRFLLGNVVVALLTAFVPFSTGLFELLPVIKHQGADLADFMKLNGSSAGFLIKLILVWIVSVSCFAFLSNFIREIIKDLQDQEGDKTIARKTLPIVLGQQKTKLITHVLLVILLGLLAYAAKYYLGDDLSTAYFALAFGLPIVGAAILVQRNNFKWSSNLLKLVMLFGICYLYFVENQFF